MIKVGVSPGMMYEDPNRTSFAPKKLNFIVQDMARYLSRDGVLPITVPSLESMELRAFVGEMDGIVLQGGDDIAPETYGEEPIGKWRGDSARDLIELEIIEYALELNKPIFGICRGFQLLNVYFGGTLYQDLPIQLGEAIGHKGINYDQNVHEISIDSNSFLGRINDGAPKATVNSIHHQGIKELGAGLEGIAWASDGIVEAYLLKDHPKGQVFAVQWHPEYDWNYAGKLLSAEAIYDHFLKFCKT